MSIVLKMDFPFLGPDEQPLPGTTHTIGQHLSAHLLGACKGNPMKCFNWGMELYNNRAVTVDEVDFESIRKLVLDSETLTVLAKGRVVNALDACKKSAENNTGA